MTPTQAPFFGLLESSLGWIELRASELGLVSLDLGITPKNVSSPDSPTLEQARVALEHYFAGDFFAWETLRQQVALDETGTPFQRSVWKVLREIPCGQTARYGEVAQRLGTQGCRAVGRACGANPLPIFTPCHRVLAQNGLGGFSAGLEKKHWLLHHEQPVETRFFARI